MKLTLRWLGTAGFDLAFDNNHILLDPYLTRIPFLRYWLGKVSPNPSQTDRYIQHADALFISHAHIDHILDAPVIAEKFHAPVYGSPNCAALLTKAGLTPALIHTIHAGDQIKVNEILVTAIRSSHLPTPFFTPGSIDPRWRFPLTARQYRMDETLSFLIQVSGFSILTAPGSDIPDDLPIDILILNPLHSSRYLEDALRRFPARVVIPSHWDVFWQSLEKPVQPMFWPACSIRHFLQQFNADSFRETVKKIRPGSIALIPERMDEICLNDFLPGTISPVQVSSPASPGHP